jgi:pyruvate ferredoxin oxidoreductase beta subunit
MANLKELSKKEEILSGGHRLCAGCGASIVVRQVLSALDDPVVVANATGCLEVSTTIYPYTSWRSPFIHNAFENAAATISGAEAMFRSLKKQGKIDREIKFIAFGGDGGTYDIGLQSLSGALERGHNFVYVCYDNEGYMNTGIQRSSATPRGAWTTTTPVGKVIPGKTQYRKDLTAVVAAHNIPYVAQASIWRWNDLIEKARKAFYTDGPAFINVLSPCPRGWRFDSKDTIEIARLAVQTNFWPLYEVEQGKWKLNYKPKERKPIKEWMEVQGRYLHLFRPENEYLIKEIQEDIDRNWGKLLVKCVEK